VTGRLAAVPPVPGAAEAVLRWKLGHHMFHLHLAAMNSLDARRQLDTRRWAELTETFDQLRILYDGATATMRYAADFSRELYEKLIRPSMAPPFTSPGFSGLLNLEHELMLDRLRRLRRQFKATDRSTALTAEVRGAATRLWEAQSRNRRNHMYVCERFVPDGTSLLSEFFRNRGNAEAGQAEPTTDTIEERQ
jgi:hypothetical protein